MKELIYGKRQRKIFVPETWEEMSSRQYIRIAGLLHQDKLTEEAQLDRLLHIMCDKNLISFLLIPVEVRMRCYEHVAWVLTAKHPLTPVLTSYKGLYAPEADFGNLELAEFHHTEAAYEEIVNERKLEALDELAAILYREPKNGYDKKRNPDGDIRRPFNFGLISWNLKRTKRWKQDVKYAILLWYDACRQSMYETHKKAFDKGKKNRSYYDGLYPMIRALAGEKYGPFDKVEKLNVHTALMEIVSSKIEEEELKRKYPDLYK